MGILSGNPKHEPLHEGEVFFLWSMSSNAKNAVSCYQTYLNHAGDKELVKLLEDLADQARKEHQDCDRLLVDNGIVPSPTLPEKPRANPEAIPVGARFTDAEIATVISTDHAVGLAACSQAMGSSMREDVGALFAKFHAAKAIIGLRLLRLNKNKGWMTPPPLNRQQFEPVEA
ncbi:DUF3231 family protein [Paenibacillus hodogayensis]|uniref:DUF3231 family protein n=1 Tax=Paenibacillus hodogayensis TaxID=279208 RepID=A0ABV5W413_9BACL